MKFRVATAMVLAGVLAGVLGSVAYAQQAAYSPPRTPDGRPDLQGMWTNSSITTLERNNQSLPLKLSPEQVKRLEDNVARGNAASSAPTNPNEGAPPVGANVGGFNSFWVDRGNKVGVVKDEPRSSWIIDPPNGKMPVSDAGRARIKTILAKRSESGPEGMNPADRCLIGSRGSGGPPMLNNIYNNTYQIVQTGDHVMIDVEMMHDARVIRMDAEPKVAPLSQWLGDSTGKWEGDTLVVTTRNWNRQHGDYEPIFLSEKAVVTERFTRTAQDEITYEFTVDDPDTYTQPWKGEMVFTTSHGPVYEYACHEGNYALKGILHGARLGVVAEGASQGE